jgi:hypothetical protein
MEEGETVESGRDLRRIHDVMPELYLCRIPLPMPVEPGYLEQSFEPRVKGIPILEIQECQALPEDLLFVISLDPKALSGAEPAEALVKPLH